MAWNTRRYPPWLLKHEERLRNRQDSFGRLLIFCALIVAAVEALLPWDSLTPQVAWYWHVGAAAILLPVLYFMRQSDLQKKQQAFALALSDKGRRLLFLDPYMEPEEFAVSESLQGAHLLPLQRQLDKALRTGPGVSLGRRLDYYYRMLPSPVHEGDRMGLLSFLHPLTAVNWAVALGLSIALMPGLGLSLLDGRGLSLLPLLLVVYLIAARANTRYAYESATFDWLRMG
ncbi:hypothetical protein IT575_08095 [bacterium]|nr:hypothetical protein [bacterium]